MTLYICIKKKIIWERMASPDKVSVVDPAKSLFDSCFLEKNQVSL